MIARSDDTKGLGVRPAVVLRAAKQVELAHRHGQVSFFRQAGDEAVKDGVFDVSVDFYPTRGGEDALHGGFGAKDQEIDHIAGVALLGANAARPASLNGKTRRRSLKLRGRPSGPLSSFAST